MTDIKFDIIARDRASKAFRDVASAADHSSSKFAKVAKYGALAAGGLVTFTAAAAAFTYKVGADYVNSLNQIQALTGANTRQMKAAASTLEKHSGLYAKMGQTTGDAASGVVELTKAGLSLQDSLKAVTATMVLAKAGELSVADASTLVANSLNTFGLKAKDAGKLANQLANAANISSADVTDLAESFKYVSPVAASAGVSMGQTSAILAELSNSGIKASSAGTALRSFLLNLEAPTAAAAKELAALNVNVFDASGKMKPLSDVIGELGGKINALTPERASVALKNLFGKVGIAGATTILKDGKKGLEQYTQGVNKAGAASKLAQAKSQGLAGEIASLKAQAISAAQEIYRKFSPALDKRLRSFVQQFKDGTGAGGKFRDALDNVKKIAQELWPAMKKTAEWTGNFLGYLASHKTELKVLVGTLVALKGASMLKNSGAFSLGKSVAGRALGSAIGGVQKVFVVNPGFGGGGGGGLLKTGEKLAGGGALATAAEAAVPIAAAAVAAGALAYIAVKVQGGPAKPQSPGYRDHAGGMSPAQSKADNAAALKAMYPYAQIASGIKATTTALDSIKGHAAGASRSLEEIGPHAEQMSHRSVAAVQALNGKATGLDAIQAHAAAASRGVDQIGPHTQHATDVGIAAIKNLDAYLAARHEAKIYADTSQAMTNIRVMQQAVDQLHGKTIIIRTTGGHVAADPTGGGPGYNPNAAPPPTQMPGNKPGSKSYSGSAGAGASGGSSKSYSGSAGAGASGGSSKFSMGTWLDKIAGKQLTLTNAIARVASLVSSAKAKVSNLKGIRAGFRSTFQADSIFGHDFSHTTTVAPTMVNGVAVDQGSTKTTPGTIADILKFQRQQRNKARSLARDVKKVTGMGLSKALVRQLESQGASGAATLHALAQGNRSQIAQLNSLDKQTSHSMKSAGMRAGNYVRGGSINADIHLAQRQERVLERLEHHLKQLAHSEKKGETIVVQIDSEAVITAIHRRNHRKGVKTAGM